MNSPPWKTPRMSAPRGIPYSLTAGSSETGCASGSSAEVDLAGSMRLCTTRAMLGYPLSEENLIYGDGLAERFSQILLLSRDCLPPAHNSGDVPSKCGSKTWRAALTEGRGRYDEAWAEARASNNTTFLIAEVRQRG